MNKELEKEDLINLVKGTSPHYKVMDNPSVRMAGELYGFPNEKWTWNDHQLERMEEYQLIDLYTLCRDSWK